MGGDNEAESFGVVARTAAEISAIRVTACVPPTAPMRRCVRYVLWGAREAAVRIAAPAAELVEGFRRECRSASERLCGSFQCALVLLNLLSSVPAVWLVEGVDG